MAAAVNGLKPAFPTVEQNGTFPSIWNTKAGLTKRELIAALAMQGYIASYVGPELCKPADAAKRGIEYADALLVELENATT